MSQTVEEIKVHALTIGREPYGAYLIIGRDGTGKISIIKDLIDEVKPKMRIIFTERRHKWRDETILSKVKWPIDRHALPGRDPFMHVISENIQEQFEKFVNAWKAMKTRNRDDRASAVFVFDCVPWTREMLRSQTFREMTNICRHLQASIIIAYDPDVRCDMVEGVWKDYIPVFSPAIRSNFNAVFLYGPNQDDRHDQRVYQQYFHHNHMNYEAFIKLLKGVSGRADPWRFRFLVLDNAGYKHPLKWYVPKIENSGPEPPPFEN